jgi:hypothetical protein
MTQLHPISATGHAACHHEADFARGNLVMKVASDDTERVNARYIAENSTATG